MPQRTWKNNPFIGLGLVAIAVVAAWLTYREVRPSKKDIEYSYVLKCLNPNCEKLFMRSYPEGEQPPFRCPACEEKQAYPALRCTVCGRVFPSLLSPSRQPPYLCPYHNEGERAYALPVEPGQIPLSEESSPR